MMAADKAEEIIKEIAVKHGVAVSRDDPIMILHTLNERLLQESAAGQQEILERFKQELEAIAHRWGEDAGNKAEKTLNAALTASRGAMTRFVEAAAEAAAETVRSEVEAAMAQLARPVRDSRRVALMNLVAAGMAIVAAALAVWAAS
jgi:hypothetical protein